MACTRCDELNLEWKIRTPGELTKAIRILQGNLDDGALKEVEGDSVLEQQPLLSLPETGPWPDIVNCHFACTSWGERFKLAAETYHGSGGSWSPNDTDWPSNAARDVHIPTVIPTQAGIHITEGPRSNQPTPDSPSRSILPSILDSTS